MSGRSLSDVLEKGDKLLRPWNPSHSLTTAPSSKSIRNDHSVNRNVSPLRRRQSDPTAKECSRDVNLNQYRVPENENLPPLCNIIERSPEVTSAFSGGMSALAGSISKTTTTTTTKRKSDIEHVVRKLPTDNNISAAEIQRIAEQQLADCEREFGLISVSEDAHSRRTAALQALVGTASIPQDSQQTYSTPSILKLRSELYTIMKHDVSNTEIENMTRTVREALRGIDSAHEESGELILSLSSELIKILSKNASLTTKCSSTGREVLEESHTGPNPKLLKETSDMITKISDVGELDSLLLEMSSSVGTALSGQISDSRSKLLSLQDQVVLLQRQSRDQITQIHSLQDTSRELSSQHTRLGAENRELRQLLNSILNAVASKPQTVLQSPVRLM